MQIQIKPDNQRARKDLTTEQTVQTQMQSHISVLDWKLELTSSLDLTLLLL